MPRPAKVGDTFAVPLRKVGFGLCRIVWTNAEWRHTSVVGLDWFGARPPDRATAAGAELMELTHPGYTGPFWVRILKGLQVPDPYVLVGNIRPTAEERTLPLGDDWRDPGQLRRSSVWKAVEHTLRREHRFRNDAKYRAELDGRPKRGEIYAVPYEGGWGVLGVLGWQGRVEEDAYATRYTLAGGRTLFAQPPTLAEARALLQGNEHPIATSGPPIPDGAVRLGEAPLPEVPVSPRSYGGWQGCMPVVPADAAPAPAPPGQSPRRPPATLAAIKPDTVFESWRAKVSDEELAATRKIVARLVAALRAAKGAAAARKAIAQAVRALNAADTFIETVEREDLCLLLGDLGRSAGVSGDEVDALVDRERDW